MPEMSWSRYHLLAVNQLKMKNYGLEAVSFILNSTDGSRARI